MELINVKIFNFKNNSNILTILYIHFFIHLFNKILLNIKFSLHNQMEKKFEECVILFDEIRAPLLASKESETDGNISAHECLIKFDEFTSRLWALRQQAIHGDNTFQRENFLDTNERSWMWAWIKGEQKWSAWNKCRGMSLTDAKYLFIEGVQNLKRDLPSLLNEWTQEHK